MPRAFAWMRISSKTTDRGHAAFLALCEARKRPRVLLDGREITNVVTADEELGEVVRRLPPARRNGGRHGPAVQDEEEILRGRVRITIVHPAPEAWG